MKEITYNIDIKYTVREDGSSRALVKAPKEMKYHTALVAVESAKNSLLKMLDLAENLKAAELGTITIKQMGDKLIKGKL